jgi:hypothetical protein
MVFILFIAEGNIIMKGLLTCACTKILTVNLLILLLGCVSFAQEVKWDSTYRPDIYPSKVAMFRSFKHSRKDVVFIGNSITFWAEWGELLGMQHIKNRGIPGDIISEY